MWFEMKCVFFFSVYCLAFASEASAKTRIDRSVNPVENVRFHLFTADNGTAGEHLRLHDLKGLEASSFNAAHSTRFLIHGWYGDFLSGINYRLCRAYHQHVDAFNVIVVDWSPTSQQANYMAVRMKLPTIGREIAEFIQFMHQHGGLQLNRTQLIGHSLGAHVAGFVGKQLMTDDGDPQLAAIVGLDPARPLFDVDKPTQRLAAGDAQYVETIHTNRGLKGFSRPIGTAAFYPNWGAKQQGCGSDLTGSCSHTRAVLFFEESITQPERRRFRAQRCANGYDDIKRKSCTMNEWVDMGGEPLMQNEVGGLNGDSKQGVFFMATRDRSPFAMFQDEYGWLI